MTFKLGIQYQGLGPYKVCSNDDLQQGQICSQMFFYGKMLTVDTIFIETIEVYELKVGTIS